MAVDRINAAASRIAAALETVVVGQQEVVANMLVGVLAQGHVLLEGPPGVAKTLLVRSLATLLGLDFGRVQFTPDLMPSDVIGTNVFDPAQRTFVLRKGPLFTNFLLADEINRAPAKTQAALLEAMQERQATIDGTRIPLPAHFTVFATQNPLEYEGTYPLPEAELDRFLLKIQVGYPAADEERAILARYRDGHAPDSVRLQPVIDESVLAACQAELAAVRVDDAIVAYAVEIVRQTRLSRACLVGASPRGAVALFLAARARATLAGRDFVVPDDVKAMARPALAHRITLKPEAEI
ncbi:MAG TPA: MoxR family ATPase, partial [Polyangia bacterium]